MLRLLQAGLVAGGIQAIVVIGATTFVIASVRYGFPIATPRNLGSSTALSAASLAPLLAWIYILTALGLALTQNRFVEATAVRVREASRRLHPAQPDFAAKTLLVQFAIASVAFMIVAFQSPPGGFAAMADALGGPSASAIAWPGLMSIGFAIFGATAHAAARAF